MSPVSARAPAPTPDSDYSSFFIGQTAKEKGWPLEVKDGLIGSCTNSSYEDMSRVASLMKQVQHVTYAIAGRKL